MKITEKDENGDYITYEDATDYIIGKTVDKLGCSGCLVTIGIIVFIIYKILT